MPSSPPIDAEPLVAGIWIVPLSDFPAWLRAVQFTRCRTYAEYLGKNIVSPRPWRGPVSAWSRSR